MTNKVIFNADDFGISLGVNEAIEQAYKEGILNAASLMINQKYALQAIEMSKNMPDLDLGLHINLTNEKATLTYKEIPLLADKDGRFKNGFLKLFLLSLIKPKELSLQVRAEMEAQILKARQNGVKITHVDSHRHVHMIVPIFKELLYLKEKYAIDRIRVINECAFMSLKTNKSVSYLFDGGLIKYFLLRFFAILNGYKSDTYFYTMLYTCKLSKDHFQQVFIPKGYRAVEVMIHPSKTAKDKQHIKDIFDPAVLSDWRDKEFETLMDKSILNNFVFSKDYPYLYRLYFKAEKLWFHIVPEKVRFLLVGGFNTVFAYGVFAFLLQILKLPYLLALIVQYFITVNVSIFTMRYYVFESKGNLISEFTKGWSVYIGLFFLNSVGLSFLVEICHIPPVWAQGVYLVFSTVMTYILHKYFSFRKKIK